jgi:cytochrome c oxidase subunit 4
MSAETATETVEAGHEPHHLEHSHGLSDFGYVRVAIALAVITGVEVAWSYLPWGDGGGLTSVAEVGGLLVMMAIKFVVVASNFMHLKFDDKVLTRVFYSGLVLAVFVYLVALQTFHFF